MQSVKTIYISWSDEYKVEVTNKLLKEMKDWDLSIV